MTRSSFFLFKSDKVYDSIHYNVFPRICKEIPADFLHFPRKKLREFCLASGREL